MLAFALGFSWMHLVVPTLAGVAMAARWILLRRQVSLKAGLEARFISDVPPSGHPASVLDGGSWVGWWRYHDSQLEVHDQFLVLKRKRDPLLAPIVFAREGVTSLKLGRGPVGATDLIGSPVPPSLSSRGLTVVPAKSTRPLPPGPLHPLSCLRSTSSSAARRAIVTLREHDGRHSRASSEERTIANPVPDKKTWTALEFEKLSPAERTEIIRAGIVTDLDQVPPAFLERTRANVRDHIAATESASTPGR